jgi:hypothetical protein
MTLAPIENVDDGGIGAVTVTLAVAEADPPVPVHVIVYVVVTLGVTAAEPDVPLVTNPVPMKEFALVEVQFNVAD